MESPADAANRQLVELSAYEDNLIAGLKKIVPRIDSLTHFFVRIDNEDWYGGRNAELNRILIQRSYGSKGVFLDAIFAGAPTDPMHTVIFGPDDQGVFSPSTQAYVPYKQSVFPRRRPL